METAGLVDNVCVLIYSFIYFFRVRLTGSTMFLWIGDQYEFAYST